MLLFVVLHLVYAHEPASATKYLGSGFDYKTGTYGLAPIIHFTYEKNNTWTSPHTNKTFSVPDQMFLNPFDKTFESVTQSVSETFEEFYEMFTARYSFSAGISIGIVGIGFDFDQQLGFIKDSIKQKYAEFVHGTHYWTFNVGSLYPIGMLPLDPMFKEAIENFPQKIVTQEDNDYANEFTQTFGQFITYKSVFGAQVDFNVAVSETIKKNYDKEWKYTQVGFSFHYYLFNISAGGFENRTSIHIDQEFLKNSKANTTFYGGNPSLAKLDAIDSWVHTIDQNLFPLNSSFVPIWNIVKDPIKKQTMQDYMIAYLKS